MAGLSKKVEKKLKILMLHGYRQNETIFKDRTGGLRRKLKDLAEFVFCEAPHEVSPFLDGSNDNKNQEDPQPDAESVADNGVLKGWWLKSKEFPERDIKQDFEETLKYMNEIFEQNGPFDVVWAFSMGATLLTLLCKISSDNLKNANQPSLIKYKHIHINNAILAATSQSSETIHDSFYDLSNKLDIRSLHIIGKTDRLVPYEKSLDLTNYFKDPKVYLHDGGHFMPANMEARNIYSEFLKVLFNCDHKEIIEK